MERAAGLKTGGWAARAMVSTNFLILWPAVFPSRKRIDDTMRCLFWTLCALGQEKRGLCVTMLKKPFLPASRRRSNGSSEVLRENDNFLWL